VKQFCKKILGIAAVGLYVSFSTVSLVEAQEELTPWDVELFDAIYSNDIKKIRKILKAGVDVYTPNATGKNAMEFARYMARHEIADVLELYAKSVQTRVSSIEVKFTGEGKQKSDSGEYRVFDEDALQRELDKLNYGVKGSALADIPDDGSDKVLSNEQLALEVRKITGGVFGFASTTEYVEVASQKLAEEKSYNPFKGFFRALTGSRDNQVLVVKKKQKKKVKPVAEKTEEKASIPVEEQKPEENSFFDWLTPDKKKDERKMRVEVVTVEEKNPNEVKVSVALDKLKDKEEKKKQEEKQANEARLVQKLDLKNATHNKLGDEPADTQECVTRKKKTFCVHETAWPGQWAEVFKLKTSLPFADSRMLARYKDNKAVSFHVFFESRNYRVIKEFFHQQIKEPSSVWHRTRRVLTKGIVPYEVTAWRTEEGQILEIIESSDYRSVGLREGHGAVRLLMMDDRTKALKGLRQADLMIMATKRLRSAGSKVQ
jgi:hypothetical protein